MSGNYGQSGYQNQGSDDCSIIPPVYLIPTIDLRFIAGYDQSQSNRGQSNDNYGSNQGFNSDSGDRSNKSQSRGGYGGQGGDTQGYGGGGGDQCIPSFPEFLAWNAEIAFIRWSDPRRL